MTRNPIDLRTRLVALGAVGVLTLGGAWPPALIAGDAAMKCAAMPSGQDPHLVMDGRFVERPREGIDMEREDLHTVMIVCWDPVQQVFHARRGEPVIGNHRCNLHCVKLPSMAIYNHEI